MANRSCLVRAVLLFWFCILSRGQASGESPPQFEVDVEPTLSRLLLEQDTDRDHLITARDRNDPWFQITSRGGETLLIHGHYPLANLLMILAKHRDASQATALLTQEQLYRFVPEHVRGLIAGQFWDQLTRRLDAQSLENNFADPKICANWCKRIYVPFDDSTAWAYYTQIAKDRPYLGLEVLRLPLELTTTYVKSLDSKPGILSLAMGRNARGQVEPLPYIVPGGRFNEMYGWDSYFIALGLLADGKVSLAQALVDHLVYEIKHYGKILNANRTYYLSRSQPPLLTSMAVKVYQQLPKTPAHKAWLAEVMEAAIVEYKRVWMHRERLTANGLSRYYGFGHRLPPEVEVSSYVDALAPLARKHRLPYEEFARLYDQGVLSEPELDDYLLHDRAMRESGHDTTHGLVAVAANLNTVALNSLLYKYESDIAHVISTIFAGQLPLRRGGGRPERAEAWTKRAQARKKQMMALMWNKEKKLFFDYDFVRQQQTSYISATTLYPLWAGLISPAVARKLIPAALSKLEMNGGLVASALESLPPEALTKERRQWDYPYGWAPHQMLAWEGLQRYGFRTIAERLQYRWLHTIAVNAARFNSAITEKYNVVNQSLEANVEYGNVGASFQYYPQGGFGWTNASFAVALPQLSKSLTPKLRQLVPPQWIMPPPTLHLHKQATNN